MGNAVSAGANNEELTDNLCEAEFIRSPKIERIFRAVDRGEYVLPDHRASAYRDQAWRSNHLHMSAPCIYSEVLEGLNLAPGMSFLNLGSGTGYLSTLAGLILGHNGINHGVEYYEDVIQYANKKLEDFKRYSGAMDEFDFCEPKFMQGNCLCLTSDRRYDRVYVGAGCPTPFDTYLKCMINIGGILVMPFHGQLLHIRRDSENSWTSSSLLPVSFATLIIPREDAKESFDIMDLQPESLEKLCRTKIRNLLRTSVEHEHPELCNPPERQQTKATRQKAKTRRHRFISSEMEDMLMRCTTAQPQNLQGCVQYDVIHSGAEALQQIDDLGLDNYNRAQQSRHLGMVRNALDTMQNNLEDIQHDLDDLENNLFQHPEGDQRNNENVSEENVSEDVNEIRSVEDARRVGHAEVPSGNDVTARLTRALSEVPGVSVMQMSLETAEQPHQNQDGDHDISQGESQDSQSHITEQRCKCRKIDSGLGDDDGDDDDDDLSDNSAHAQTKRSKIVWFNRLPRGGHNGKGGAASTTSATVPSVPNETVNAAPSCGLFRGPTEASPQHQSQQQARFPIHGYCMGVQHDDNDDDDDSSWTSGTSASEEYPIREDLAVDDARREQRAEDMEHLSRRLTVDSAFTPLMCEKINALPLPTILKNYLNFYRF